MDKPEIKSSSSLLPLHLPSNGSTRCWWHASPKQEESTLQTVDKSNTVHTTDEVRRNTLYRRGHYVPNEMVSDLKSRKPSLKSIQMMKIGSTDVPSPSNSVSSEETELTDEQRRELRKAFRLFVKGGKNKMAARDLGDLLRCLGWNPSEPELEEAKHELIISARGSVTFSEIERFMARRGGILYGCNDKEDIQEAFQVLDQDGDGKIAIGKFKYFMTTLGEKMSDEEVEEMLQSLHKGKHKLLDSIEFNDIIQGLDEASLDT